MCIKMKLMEKKTKKTEKPFETLLEKLKRINRRKFVLIYLVINITIIVIFVISDIKSVEKREIIINSNVSGNFTKSILLPPSDFTYIDIEGDENSPIPIDIKIMCSDLKINNTVRISKFDISGIGYYIEFYQFDYLIYNSLSKPVFYNIEIGVNNSDKYTIAIVHNYIRPFYLSFAYLYGLTSAFLLLFFILIFYFFFKEEKKKQIKDKVAIYMLLLNSFIWFAYLIFIVPPFHFITFYST